MNNEQIPKAIVEKLPDESKPKTKWIFKSKTHFFALLGAVVAWFPGVEKLIVEHPQEVLLGVYVINTILRRATNGGVHLFPKADDLKALSEKSHLIIFCLLTIALTSCAKVRTYRNDLNTLEQGLKLEPLTPIAREFAFVPYGCKETATGLDCNRPFDIVGDILDFLEPKRLIASVFEGVSTGLKSFTTKKNESDSI